MNFIDLPNIGNGTAEEQLAQIRSYIYRNNEQLNATLANLSVDKMWEPDSIGSVCIQWRYRRGKQRPYEPLCYHP